MTTTVEGLGAAPASTDELRQAAINLKKATDRLDAFVTGANKAKKEYEEAVTMHTRILAGLLKRNEAEVIELGFDGTDEEPAKNNIRVWFDLTLS